MKFLVNTRSCSVLFLFLLFFQCYLAAGFDKKSALRYGWVVDPTDFYLQTVVDSTINPHLMILETLGEKKGIISLLAPVFQLNEVSLQFGVKVKYKTENCNKLFLKITSIGSSEKICSEDTIYLSSTTEWNESVQFVNIKKALLLNVSIEASGMNRSDNDQSVGKIWISNLELTVNGKDIIDILKQSDENSTSCLTQEDVVCWDDNTFNALPFFENKILALGETTHGTKTMNDIAISIMKERILKTQCKFVLFEIPLEYSFTINRYVKNDPNFTLEDFSAYFDNTLLTDSVLSFIQWVKDYNLTRERKVSFLGFDINPIQLKSQIDLFNFFYNLNLDKQIKSVDSLCHTLLKTSSFQDICLMFEKDLQLANLLDEDELKLMRHCLEVSNRSAHTYFRYINRDHIMSENASFIIDNFLNQNESMTLFGHFGHLNYVSMQDLSVLNHFSLGYHMRNKYNDDYICIALTTDHGTAMLAKKTKRETEVVTLISGSQSSIEYQINKLNVDSVYVSMDKFNNSDVLKLRYIGNQNQLDQFKFFVPKSRMAGVLFVKEVTAIEKDKDVLKRNVNQDLVVKAYQIALKKIKNI